MDETTVTFIDRARELGEGIGRSVATWQDSFTDDEHARACLSMDEDGDPAWFDHWSAPAPLSGEWADSWTPADVADELGIDADDWDAIDAACLAFEDGYHDAFREHVITAARAYLTAG